ncbi:hypothetical protein A3758_30785 [Oleiphilus sp. HI0118]|nr:hypothetical protein A3758_30785 [Oleiphilus sp. HI0118]
MAINAIANITATCDTNSHALLRPSTLVNNGNGRRSIKGAHKNLNEYASAAQLKYVTVERSTPASLSHKDKEEKISSSGTPAEKPKNSIDRTLGCLKDCSDCRQSECACSIVLFF